MGTDPATVQFNDQVTAGQFVGHVGTQINYLTPSAIEAQQTSSQMVGDALKTVINDRALKAASQFGTEGLRTPVNRVDPDTYEVDFFKTAVPEQEYRPNLDFVQQKQKQGGRSVAREDFFSNLHDGSRARTVAVVGGAGYGKTEMLRRFVADVLENNIPSLTEVDVVHYMNFRDFDELPQMLTAGKLLFGGTVIAEKVSIERVVDWILENQEKFMLVVDGADQYPDEDGKLGKKSSFESHKSEGKKVTILNSILSGRLFPGIRVLYSSREHRIRYFEDSVRPDRVVALAGFPHETIKTLVHELAADEGPAVWKHLTTKSPTLLSASSVPMILVFNVSVLIRHKEAPPETLTEVLLHVLNDLTTSDHVTEPARIYDVIHELKAMCFRGTEAGRVTFTKSDLPARVREEDYRDLMIPLLGIQAMNQRLVEGLFRFFTVHQIIQESLAALHLAKMEIQDFRRFADEDLHSPHWAIVRRLLCGILINESALKIAKGIDPSTALLRSNPSESKSKCLKESLGQQIQKLQHGEDHWQKVAFLELLHAVHECGDNVITTSVKRIDVEGMTLTQNDIHVITTIIDRCQSLDLLALPDLRGMEKHMPLASALKDSGCKIQELRIHTMELQHDDLTERDINDLATIISRCTFISRIYLPALDTTYLRILASAVKETNIKIEYLAVGDKENKVRISHEGALAICDMLPHMTVVLRPHYILDEGVVKLFQEGVNTLGDKGPEFGIKYDVDGYEVDIEWQRGQLI